MLSKKSWLLALYLLLPWHIAHAEVAVLVHGYLSQASTWEFSGVNAALRQTGWKEGGQYSASPAGLIEQPAPFDVSSASRVFYTINLPSLAPAMLQATWLESALQAIENKHPHEAITVVGHSAGGVVARLALVRYGPGQVQRLITIAAPHLGTHRAAQALDAVDSSGPFGFIKEFIAREKLGNRLYNTLKWSRGILFDLLPPRPGNLLFWLNAQPHPDIQYVSIIRSNGFILAGDWLVPAFSQDMNRVPALQGKVKVYLSPQGHALSPLDGRLLADIL